MTSSLKIADYENPPLCLHIKGIVVHLILPFPMPCASSFFITAPAMILKYLAKQTTTTEEVCLPCSLRQVVVQSQKRVHAERVVVRHVTPTCSQFSYA